MIRNFLFVLMVILCQPVFSADVDKAAGCVLRVGERLLLVQGGPKNQWALPGGFIDDDELPWQTARRESYEEVGLHAIPLYSIASSQDGFRLFACRAIAPIPVSDWRVNTLGAPHLGTESVQAGFFNAREISGLNLRFPKQIQQLLLQLESIPESTIQQLAGFPASDISLHEKELPFIKWFISITADWDIFFQIGNFFGELWFYVLCLPLIARWFGWRYMHRMVLGLVLITIVTQTLKIAFAMPRPFHYWPALSFDGAAGYGMPSGHAFSALFFFGALAWWSRGRLPLWLGMLLALLFAVWTAASRVWLGVHFISDVAVGMLLAICLLYLERIQDIREKIDGHQLSSSKYIWCGLSLISLVCSLVLMQESLYLPFALSLGYAWGAGKVLKHEVSWWEALCLLIGMIGLTWLSAQILALLDIFWQQALLYILSYVVLGAWLSCGAYLSAQRLLITSR
ncbi:phosphatase PAP2 family protein [Chromobacterium piscinae]|uniref:bifunctional NUDIX hydrolase/phosphatase PAP2 family protein n=1 Tax=Chromobacterium piscinae TaxID=686831 RepID=UPI001E380AC8|nr:bifunctional NUDIX hydrolase/phosphatase PAP2 family protein [Chromobacterium piscinae]MCD4506933.1 phosphatase PAP2 family protein [Chromobacterium piscinae]